MWSYNWKSLYHWRKPSSLGGQSGRYTIHTMLCCSSLAAPQWLLQKAWNRFFHFKIWGNNPYVTCRSAEGLSQVCHRSVQSYSRPIWRKTEVCKSAYCLWQTSHENDFFFDCVLPFILFAASLLQTFRDFWWLCNKDLLLCLHLICSRRCADNHPHETCDAVQRHKIASK